MNITQVDFGTLRRVARDAAGDEPSSSLRCPPLTTQRDFLAAMGCGPRLTHTHTYFECIYRAEAHIVLASSCVHAFSALMDPYTVCVVQVSSSVSMPFSVPSTTRSAGGTSCAGLARLDFVWLGLTCLDDLAWLGLAWLGLAWLGVAWRGVAWLGVAWLGLAWLDLTQRRDNV